MIVYSSDQESESPSSEDQQLASDQRLTKKNQRRLKNAIAYRYFQHKQEERFKKLFIAWRDFSLLNYRCKIIEAIGHHEKSLMSKAFDGIIDYSISSIEFRQKLVIFYYKYLTSKFFLFWREAHQSGQLKKERKLKEVILPNLEALTRIRTNLSLRQLATAFTLIASVQKDRKNKLDDTKGKKFLEESQQKSLLINSRQSVTNFSNDFSELNLNRSKRKLAPIVEQVELPKLTKKKSESVTVEQMKMTEKQEIQRQDEEEEESRRMEKERMEKEQERAKARKRKQEERNRILSIISKGELLSLCLLKQMNGEELQKLKHCKQASSGGLEKIRLLS